MTYDEATWVPLQMMKISLTTLVCRITEYWKRNAITDGGKRTKNYTEIDVIQGILSLHWKYSDILVPSLMIFDSAVKSQEKMTLSLKLWDADTNCQLPETVKAVLKKTANLIFWALLRKMTLRLAINQFTYPKLIEWMELWNKCKVSSLALVYGEPGGVDAWIQNVVAITESAVGLGGSASLYHKENPLRNQHLQGG